MTAQQLKNSILQMAVQGKLVPQDPNDEPASVLLERIRAEKERLIKEKKIKREKNPSVIFKGADNTPYEKIGDEVRSLADEVPFDIPDSWEWVRISSITALVTKGTTPRGGNVAYSDNGIGFLRAENVAGLDRLDLSKLNHIDEATHTSYLKRSILEADDVLITIAGTLGRTAIVKEENLPLNANQAVAIIRLVDSHSVDLRYLVYALNAPAIQDKLTSQKKITAIPNLTLEIISDCLVPIPPLNEQRRIVNQFALFVPQIAGYEGKQTELNALNAGFPEALKKSILQEAVQGKLVPQDPFDEPAEALLERIQAEKQRLIKEGKIKKDKHESVIFRRDNSHYEKLDGVERCIDDELPFEVPETWEWVRLGTVFQHNTGKALNASNRDGEKLTYITTSNLYWDRFVLNNLKTMPFTDSEVDKCTVQQGDLLVCEGGDIGRAAIWASNEPMRIQNHIHRLRAYVPVCSRFFYHLFYLYKGAGWIGGKGIAIQGLSSNAIHNLLFPLPPLHEQERIVSAIDTALSTVQKM